jgi:hypothetical protein
MRTHAHAREVRSIAFMLQVRKLRDNLIAQTKGRALRYVLFIHPADYRLVTTGNRLMLHKGHINVVRSLRVKPGKMIMKVTKLG